ncbi:MAG: response regulator [Desulfobulbaceae bacterium]|nr:MAG: response regulator [Desulfobulbaceae bacterium]
MNSTKNSDRDQALMNDLKKRLAYLERKNTRLLEQQIRQERINDINRVILKKQNHDLERALELAQQANSAKTDFLANISHEIRTPLNIVLGMGQILADTKLDKFQEKQLATLQKFGKQLLDILNNVMEFSRIDSGEIEVHKEPFQLSSLLTDLDEMIRPLAAAKQLNFTISNRLQLSEHRIGDYSKIFQILSNILNNALKYTETGMITLTIEPDLGAGGEVVLFTIEDTGIGIPEDKQAIIFDRFSQADNSLTRSSEGVGLGLAICVRLVELLGGTLTLTSQLGKGSAFQVSLPLVLHEPLMEATAKAAHTKLQNLSGIRVLIAEDVAENTLLIDHYLERYSFVVDCARDGMEALTLLEDRGYDLVLMDIRMPRMDGIQAIQKIRHHANSSIRDVPVVAITAHAFEEQKRAYLKDGFSVVLTKPFNRDELIRAISRALGQDSPGTIYNHADINHTRRSLEYVEAISGEHIPKISKALQPLINDVIKRLKHDLSQIRMASEKNDMEKLSELCHAARGLSGMYKLDRLVTLIDHISLQVKADNLKMVPTLVEQSLQHLADIERACNVQEVKSDF